MSLPADILKRAKKDYPEPQVQADLIQCLCKMPQPEQHRVARCVLVASEADYEKFMMMNKLAHTDYRDAIMCGEYEYPSEKRIRDLSKPFE